MIKNLLFIFVLATGFVDDFSLIFNTMITPTESSSHTPRDVDNMIFVYSDCGTLLHKCRRCNTFYEKTENSPMFLCTHCKFAVEQPLSPVPVTSSIITSDSIDDVLDEEETEQINVEQETLTTEPPKSHITYPRDSRTISLTIRTWLTLMVISMVIGYAITFI